MISTKLLILFGYIIIRIDIYFSIIDFLYLVLPELEQLLGVDENAH